MKLKFRNKVLNSLYSASSTLYWDKNSCRQIVRVAIYSVVAI